MKLKQFNLLLILLLLGSVAYPQQLVKYRQLSDDYKESISRKEWRQAVREAKEAPGEISLSPIDRIYFDERPSIQVKDINSVSLTSWGRDVMMPQNIRQWVIDDCGKYNFIAAIADSGTDTAHIALDGPWWLPGTNYSGDSNEHWHGTHVAGIVWQLVGEVIQEHGNGQLKEVQTLGGTGSGSFSNATNMVTTETAMFTGDIAAGTGVFINNSWGYTGPPVGFFETELQKSREAGLVWIFSGGNSGRETDSYPASSDNGTAVASVTSAIKRSGFSTIGDFIDVAAPGSGINSTMPGNREASASGTSMAAPFVTGLACLAYGKYGPVLQGPAMNIYLDYICTDISPDGYDKETGWGIPYVVNMLETDPCDVPGIDCDGDTPPPPPPPTPDPETYYVSGIADAGYMMRYKYEGEPNWRFLIVHEFEWETVGGKGEDEAYDQADEIITAYFKNRGIVLPPEMDGYSATWWCGQFLEYIARNEYDVDLDIMQMIGQDEAGRKYSARDFDRADAAVRSLIGGPYLESVE